MARDNQEQPDVPPFEYRAGVTMPAIGGMYRRGDPSQIPPHRLHLGVNIRLADGETGDRPGLVLVEGTEEDACITGIFEIEDFAVGVYITKLAKASGDPVVPSAFRIMAFNEEKTPPELNFWDEDATFVKKEPSPWREGPQVIEAFNTFQRFNDILLIANGETVYEAQFSEDESLPRLDLSALFSLPEAAAGDIQSTCVRRERVDDPQTGNEFEKDVLYMGGVDGEIWRYDGTTVELVHTLASGGRMQVISWHGAGLVAAGDSAGGFSSQEQPGFAWADEAWGQNFTCNGLCEFLGEVVFVGDFGRVNGYAMHWDGSGAPVVFSAEGPAHTVALDTTYRTPVVSGGALHFLRFQVESSTPPDNAFVHLQRWTSFAAGDQAWLDLGTVTGPDPGFLIPYAGAMLLLSRNEGPAAAWPEGDNILLVFSGATPTVDTVYNWPLVSGDRQLQPGSGYEAIPL